MDHDRFLVLVQRTAEVDREVAERATRAALETLAERLLPGEARDLAEQVPDELARWLSARGPRAAFDAEEFIRRVAERDAIDVATAEKHAKAVFYALSRAITRDEFDDMVSELPKDYRPLLEK